ncbi:mitochondrial GTPase [Tieghemostelium lacteum]|uniref:Mitochondrial Rho GTPase n=1 Tax=Tieghemostelium lacteum TaxID=361077 RepID=A0A152A7P4_TIELA|nr:mitochondrial GTPase [Tieghemostelium lacteum]|eukprot:KYR02228.1 mitochondrial GTPase [Tieghemostelium lacteum]
MKPDIKLLFIGDKGVGKTTIISSLINEYFSENVPSVIPEIIIPNQDQIFRIVDSDNSDQTQRDLEIKRSDAIIMVYSIDRIDTFMNIRMKWLPLVKSLKNHQIPILILGNKLDLVNDDQYEKNSSISRETIELLKSDYNNTLLWSEISSLDIQSVIKSISEIEYHCVYPESPLWDRQNECITPLCQLALNRIFKICDVQRDSLLDQSEYEAVQLSSKSQLEIFSLDFQQLIDNLSAMFPNNNNDTNVVVSADKKLTLYGFTQMVKLILANHNQEKVWKLLRYFQYEDNLELDSDYLSPKFTVIQDHNVTLSDEGLKYLTDLFLIYQKESSSSSSTTTTTGLSIDNIVDLFKDLSPIGVPAGLQPLDQFNNVTTEIDNNNNNKTLLTLSGWLSYWQQQTYQDYKTTLMYLAYLGCKDTTNMINLQRNRKLDQRYKQMSRCVINCLVFGKESCGKSTFLKTFIGHPLSSIYQPTNDTKQVCGQILNSKYLIEYTKSLETLQNSKQSSTLIDEISENADLICLLYDDNDEDDNQSSFQYVESIYKLLNNKQHIECSSVPFLFIKTKSSSTPQLLTESTNKKSKESIFFNQHPEMVACEFSSTSSNSVYHQMVKQVENSVLISLSSSSSKDKSLKSNINMYKYLAVIGGSLVVAISVAKYFISK